MMVDPFAHSPKLLRVQRGTGLLVLAIMVCSTGQARAEISHDLSGFGTFGGAVSDQDFIYQRFVHDGGTINRDSVIGVQLDTRLGDAWGLTLQAKAAPSSHSDNAWEPTLNWAFISWRPTNDWLLRAGRLRLPLLLYSANQDVGGTFDFARLPTDAYSVSPTPDVNGLFFAKTWLSDTWEWTLEGYLGTAHTDWRFYLRDGLEPQLAAGALYNGLDLNLGGLVLSLRAGEHYWRIGLHRVEAEMDYGTLISEYPYVSLEPGIGYYQTLPDIPGPGVPTVDKISIDVLTLGAEIALPHDVRLIGEYVRRRFNNATAGPDVHAGYLALLRPVGNWTPYLYWSGIRSTDDALDLYELTNRARVPASLPNASLINAAQVVGADLRAALDQQSLAIGTSYSLSPTSKLKAEWMHVRTGRVSNFIDAPSGEDSGGRQFNVFSLSYSFMF